MLYLANHRRLSELQNVKIDSKFTIRKSGFHNIQVPHKMNCARKWALIKKNFEI